LPTPSRTSLRRRGIRPSWSSKKSQKNTTTSGPREHPSPLQTRTVRLCRRSTSNSLRTGIIQPRFWVAIQVHCSDQHDDWGFHVPAGRQHCPHRSPNNHPEPERFCLRSSLGPDGLHSDDRCSPLGLRPVGRHVRQSKALQSRLRGLHHRLGPMQSIFWINLPIGAFATFWAYKKLRELGTVHHERIDLPGNVLFAGGLTAFLVGLTLGALSGYTLVDVASMGAGLLMVGGFVYVELHSSTPLMDLTLFKIRAFSAGILSNFLASIARSGVSLVLTIYFQGVLIYDAFKAGLALIPFAVAFVSLGPLSGYLSDKYGPRFFTTTGLSISTAGLIGLALIPANVSYTVLALLMALVGAGGGMFVAPNISSIMSSAPVTRRGVASGMSATLVTTGALLSLSISFAVLA